MRKTEHQVTIDRGWTYQRAISLRTMCIVAVACLIAGAMLPSPISFIAVPASHAAAPGGDGNEQAFISENDVAMNRMMADMTVKPSGDVNRDFVEMMIPHHQGAIDMAKALLVHGDNETLRRIAQEIVITQRQEIVAMRLAVGEPAPPTAAPGTDASPATGNTPAAIHMSPNSMKMK